MEKNIRPESMERITTPELAQKFIEELEEIEFLAQGTIYPDILESDGVKAHHNVGGIA